MRRLMFTAVAMMAFVGSSKAETAAERSACTPDVLSLCFFEIPNVDKIKICLLRERANLGKSCRSVMDAHYTASGAKRTAAADR